MESEVNREKMLLATILPSCIRMLSLYDDVEYYMNQLPVGDVNALLLS